MGYTLKGFINAVTVSRVANVFYYELTNRFQSRKDKHNFRELVYIDNGYINIEADNYTGILTENQLIIHQANECHRLTCPENKSSDIIIIGFECYNTEIDAFSYAPVSLTEYQKRLLAEVIKEGKNTYYPPYNSTNEEDPKKRETFLFGSDQLIKIKLENLFIELIRSAQHQNENEKNDELTDERMQDVYRYINENYKEKINLSELCFLFATNKTTLCNKFRKVYGETIVSYINKKKIKEAKKLLRGTDLNLTEISSRVGFSSVYYFSRTFKQYEKQSPTSYIKTIKSRLTY